MQQNKPIAFGYNGVERRRAERRNDGDRRSMIRWEPHLRDRRNRSIWADRRKFSRGIWGATYQR